MSTKATTAGVEAALTKADPQLGRVIAAVIERIGRQRVGRSRATPFEALVRAVVYQSIASKAASTIYTQLRERVGLPLIPLKVLELRAHEIAKAGLSKTKVAAVRSLAEWFRAEPGRAKLLRTAKNEEVVNMLSEIPGVGAWTANVLLIFNLGRRDVMPASDLGIRRGVQLAYGLKMIATPKEVAAYAERWRPYRSIASVYLWNAVKLKLSRSDL